MSILTNGSTETSLSLLLHKGVVLFFAAVCLLLTARANAQEAPAHTTQAIQVNVKRVNVGVVVTDNKGKFVEGLPREVFHVFDNGTEQPVTEFSPLEVPGQVLLLVEAGPAVYFLRDANVFAANTMLNGLSPQDRVAVVRYTDAPLALLDFTADKEAARAALENIQFNLGFGDLNLSASLNAVLDWLHRVPGKKTIVLISTGVDTSPPPAVEALQSRLQSGDVPILCVSTSGPLRSGKQGGKTKVARTQSEFQAADQLLQLLAETTGGRAYFPMNAKAFQETYREVAQIVRHEYSLAFAPPVADGALHRIDVKVESGPASEKAKSPAFRVDHRQGYLAPKE
ncbi:MAG TPA: VWA domain-containing protein [Candidatus Acidoferrum sp.]|nr:VWA domain-containing protein [Candidatus Acidoferrum sp.]